MDEPLSDTQIHERKRTPYGVHLPVWASVLITIVVLVGAAAKLAPKKAR